MRHYRWVAREGQVGRRYLWAFFGSFTVYLLPLVGPHAFWLLGEELARQFTRTPHQPMAWTLANMVVALGVQAVAFIVLAWSLGGRIVRLLLPVAMIPVLFFVVEAAYLEVIPTWFLVEKDTAPERQDWTEACVAPDAWLMPVRTPTTRSTAAHERWIQRSDGRQALLRAPSCEVIEANIPRPTLQPGGRVDFTIGIVFAIPGGAAILQRSDIPTARQSWWLLARPDAAPAQIEGPDEKEGSPILSNAGDAVAWMQPIAGSTPPIKKEVHVESTTAGGSLHVVADLSALEPTPDVLLEVDTARQDILLWQRETLVTVDFDGGIRRRSSPTPSIRPQSGTYQIAGNGWLAWDAYQDEAAYQIIWSLTDGMGTHRAARGRGITDAAVDPSGSLIAVSETTMLSIGRAPDVVYVLRARDGQEVFRRYLPRYSRSSVTFFGARHFAYSDGASTHVLNISN